MAINLTKQGDSKSPDHYADITPNKSNTGHLGILPPDIKTGGVPKVRRKIDPRNEPKVTPGEMLEDEKFTQT